MPRLHVLFRIALVSMLVVILTQVTEVYFPILVSVAAAFLLHPLVVRLQKRIGHVPAIFAAILLLSIVALLTLFFLAAPIVKEAVRFAENIPFLLKNLIEIFALIEERIGSDAAAADRFHSLLEQFFSNSAELGVNAVKQSVNIAAEFFSKAVDIVVIPILVFFLLKDHAKLTGYVISLFDPKYRRKAAVVMNEIGTVIGAYLNGQILLCGLIGVIVFGGLLFFDIEYPLVLACLAAVTEAIPVIGPIAAAVPAVLLALTVSPILAGKVAIFYFAVQQFENNILVPKVMGQSVDLHPVIVIVGLLIAGQLYGVGGMILALPVIAVGKVLIKHFWWRESGNV